MSEPLVIIRQWHMTNQFNHIYLVMDAGNPVAAFTAKHEMTTYLRCRHDTFTNPLVYTFGGADGYTPSVMTMTAALADR